MRRIEELVRGAREQHDDIQPHDAERQQEREGADQQRADQIGGDHDPPAIEAIDQHPGDQADEQTG